MTEWIISSSVLIVAVILMRALFRKRISPTLRYCLWSLVLLRLLLPFSLGESALSVLNHVPDFVFEESAEQTEILIPGEERPFKPYVSETEGAKQTDDLSGESPAAIAPERKVSLSTALRILHLAGAVIVLSFFVCSNLRFASKLRHSRRDAGSFMGLSVYISHELDTPCLFGLLRPAIYLSEDVGEESCKHVLMHEHAHYCQKDHIWAWLRGICLALHWYNPLVWLAAKLSKQDGELSCDERVIRSISSQERINYGRTLISLSCTEGKPLLCAVTPLSTKGKALKERIEYVAKKPSVFLGSIALVLAAALIVTGCTFTGAKLVPGAGSSQEAQPVHTEHIGGALLDRDGQLLTKENFQLYDSAVSSFGLYLDNGSSISMTIDIELQQKAQELLEEYLTSAGDYVNSGCIIVLDVQTGAPLAIAGKAELVDPLTVSVTPGGLFYPCTALTALDVGVIQPDDSIACQGVFDRYAQEGISASCWIYDAAAATHPQETLVTALRDSCEYYFYCLGNDSGIDDLEAHARALGLGEHSGIELPSSLGLMPSRITAKNYGMDWTIGNTLETAVGEGMCSFTPMQLAQYCATVANRGTRYSASVVGSITDSGGKTIHSRSPLVLSQLSGISEESWDAVNEGLYQSLNSSDVFYQQTIGELLGDWRPAGKAAYPNKDALMPQELFMCYAPYDEPEIAVFTMTVTEPGQGLATELAYEIISDYKGLIT